MRAMNGPELKLSSQMARKLRAVALLFWAASTWGVAAPGAEETAFFEKRIRPLLSEHCLDCHGATKQKGGLRLDWRGGWEKGGASGPVVVPGKPDDSLLVRGVRYWDKEFQMPPSGRLSPAQVADLVEWVRMGAADPRSEAPAGGTRPQSVPARSAEFEQRRKHWAFQPVKDGPPPKVRDGAWPRTNVDAFLLARMEQGGVRPGPEADRRTLIRRATFDLIGLPPSPEEVEAFLKDTAPGAFARVVDRLLDSRHYGERWGRHWLDLARYADSAGNTADYPIPQAYKYRDYVIGAFNADKPYDQFIREQLAGDLLQAAQATYNPELTVATGYLASIRQFGFKGVAHLSIEDAIENTGRTFLGLSVNCARCHDHKFDPITSDDYYALYGFFGSTTFPHPGSEENQRPKDLVPLLSKEGIAQADTVRKQQLAALEARLKQAEAAKAAADALPVSPEKKAKVDAAAKAVAAAKAEHKQASDTAPYELAYAVSEGKPGHARFQVRGDPSRLGVEVPRRFVEVLGGHTLPKDCANSGRLDLAKWIADPANPLTARVMVNRIWQHHFGRGLVATPSDFGLRGQPPTHPELLDFLARRFVESGWSIKAMHRLILSSRAWQAASTAADAPGEAMFASNSARDPHNALLWRAERRRLDAESIRDALLVAAGNLERQPPGKHPFPPVHTWGFTQHNQFFALYETPHRTVYQMQQRLRKHPFLALFDGADPNAPTAAREPSTTPLQSLFMMNDKLVHEQAALFAARVQQGTADPARQVERAFQILYGRAPQPDESQAAAEFLKTAGARLAQSPSPASQAWASLSRALLGANEFLYVD